MHLFNLLGIEIRLDVFIAFFFGLVFGFILLLLIYVYAVLKGLNKKLKFREVEEEDIDEEEIKFMIKASQNRFKDKKLREEIGYGKLLSEELKEMTYDISRKFYPNSNYPYLEITIDESIELVKYVTTRLEELVDNPILKLFRGMTFRRIAELNSTKEKIEESRVVKAAKKTGFRSIASNTLKALNVVNPFYWFRKLTVDKAINVVLVKIGTSVIAITGEETYKIYSKKVFDQEKTIETEVDDLYASFKESFEKGDFDD